MSPLVATPPPIVRTAHSEKDPATQMQDGEAEAALKAVLLEVYHEGWLKRGLRDLFSALSTGRRTT
jgi:hypothetical protein